MNNKSHIALPLQKGARTYVIEDANGKALVQPCNGVELKAYDEHIAPTIINAVNCHDDLVRALDYIINGEGTDLGMQLTDEGVNLARAALEKAGVKP